MKQMKWDTICFVGLKKKNPVNLILFCKVPNVTLTKWILEVCYGFVAFWFVFVGSKDVFERGGSKRHM